MSFSWLTCSLLLGTLCAGKPPLLVPNLQQFSRTVRRDYFHFFRGSVSNLFAFEISTRERVRGCSCLNFVGSSFSWDFYFPSTTIIAFSPFSPLKDKYVTLGIFPHLNARITRSIFTGEYILLLFFLLYMYPNLKLLLLRCGRNRRQQLHQHPETL